MARQVQLVFGRHVHPVYREQVHAVPAGWEYTSRHPALFNAEAPTKLVLERSTRLGWARELAETGAFRVLPRLGYVHHVRPRPEPGVSLIHAAERLVWRSPVPYVLDLEHVLLFVLYQQAAFGVPWTRRVLERALLDERLRFLLPWSEAARASISAFVSPVAAAKIDAKTRVVLPAVRPVADTPQTRDAGPLRVLFVGTKFYEKGAVEAIRAIQAVRESHDVELDIVTFAPAAWERRLQNEPGIRLHRPGSSAFIRDLYAQSHALLFPSHMDTYGVVVGEAMAHGLPVLAPRHLALTESILDGESGLLFAAENMLYQDGGRCAFDFVLPPPASYLEALQRPTDRYVAGIAEAIAGLAADRDLYARLAAGALASVRTGHLSIERRRAILTEVYAAATDSSNHALG